METESNYVVSVFCTTYNQSKYIKKCLDSLVSQRTKFLYEVIVRDDASTDGTSEIVREYYRRYPEIIVPFIQEENLFSQGKSHISFEKMFWMSRGKYIAICEGDDFWTDPDKLQTQVDFLEHNPDFSMCCHAAYYANEDGSLRKDRFFRADSESRELKIEEIISQWCMATNSILYRKDARKDIIIPYLGTCVNGDYAQVVYFALQGKVFYINKLMSAYRVCSIGSLSQEILKNKEKYKARTLEFAGMLDRINEYTNGKYENTIKKYRDRRLFDMYANLNDRENMKKYKSAYDDTTPAFRMLIRARIIVPRSVNFVKKVVRNLRR